MIPRVRRALRFILLSLTILGMLPGVEEAAENVAHVIEYGHLPHSVTHNKVAAFERQTPDSEHGCTGIDHHCKCCASPQALPPKGSPTLVARARHTSTPQSVIQDRGPPWRSTAPPLPPPIA